MLRHLCVIGIVLVVSASSFAEKSYSGSPKSWGSNGQRKRSWRSQRSISSQYGTDSYGSEDSAAKRSNQSSGSMGVYKGPHELRALLFLGLTLLDNSDPSLQLNREADGVNRGILLGLGVDYRRGWWGGELDLYRGFMPKRNVTIVDDNSEYQRTTSQFGILAGGKGQMTYYLGPVKVIPNAGLGWGILSMKDTLAGGTNPTENSFSLSGPYATAGFEASYQHNLTFGFDYARSIFASSSITINSEEMSFLESENYQRMRFGLYFHLMKRLKLGTQYTIRTLSFTILSADSDPLQIKDTQSQFVWLIAYQL